VEPCALLELDLAYATCEGEAPFEGWSVPRVLEPATGTLACRRLRYLNLGVCGLTGEIPPSLAQCQGLVHLDLGSNGLSGCLPEFFGSMRSLRTIKLNRNKLTGPIPEALGECGDRKLKELRLFHNHLSGEVPVKALAQLQCLEQLTLSQPPGDGQVYLNATYGEAHGLSYPDGGNAQLSISAAGKAALQAALPQCAIFWPSMPQSGE